MHPIVIIQDFYDFKKCALIIESEVQIIVTRMRKHIGCRKTSSNRKYKNAACIVKKYFYATKTLESMEPVFIYYFYIFLSINITVPLRIRTL